MNALCLNCGHRIEDPLAYCPACGQRIGLQRLRMRDVVYDAWTKFTDIDRGFFTLLHDLIVRPGVVAREYIAGKRRKHFAPLDFYLIVGTLLILSFNITEWLHDNSRPRKKEMPVVATPPDHKENISDVPPADRTEAYSSDTSAASGPAASAQAASGVQRDTMRNRKQVVDNFWARYSDLVAIAAAPLLCAFFWLFYRRAGFNYTEMLVACLYMIGFTNLVYALIISPLSAALIAASGPAYIMAGIFKLFEIGYFSYFMFHLTKDIVRRPRLRASFASLIAAIFWLALSSGLIAVYMNTGFGSD